ncbi:FadR/GntR family transcriptional regulator [uncultured Ruthenibacterium sp.]|uniref:FadR/GntR family transcriptional regulator n=1 Tax=uncultured Ruthenibacterium sp. TaxID=1905347 RepID=UPI00349E891C
MEFSKLSAPSLKDLFIQQLQGKILSGELPVGTPLPPERELARQMQVSRAVVNGGLAELAAQGFLEVRPRQGTYVADYRRKGNLSTLIAIMEYRGGVLGKEEIRSILEVRRALEHLAVENAIRYASDQSLSRLGELLENLAGAKDATQAAEIAFSFQHELALAGGNSILPLIYYSFKAPVITLWIRFCRMYGIEALCRNTETLYTYLRARDQQAAAHWIDTYLGKAISGSQQIYSEK